MDDIRAPEAIAQLVVHSELGQQAVIFPQGEGRARTYFCCRNTHPRHNGADDRHARATHLGNPWYTRLYLETGPDADARRQRALPFVAQNPTRQPDTIFSGPDVPLDEEVRRRFFAED